MSYNFVHIKPQNTYLTVIDSSNKSRYLSFRKKLDAYHCITYLSKFKLKHGSFPLIDFSKTDDMNYAKEIIVPTDEKSSESIIKLLSVIEYDYEDIDKMCSMNNMNILHVTEFHYSHEEEGMKLLIGAQELNCKPDVYKMTKRLNEIFYT